MKIDMFMFDRPIELDEESTKEFLLQYQNSKNMMRQILTMFEDENEETRKAIFYVIGLRSFLDDFLEFCTEGLTAELMEALLNDEEAYMEYEEKYEEKYEEECDFEIEVDVNNDDE